jgi:hypothetical protein
MEDTMVTDQPTPHNQTSARLRALGEAERRRRPFYDDLARRIASELARDHVPGAVERLAELLGESKCDVRVALIQLATEGPHRGHRSDAA